VIAANLNAPGSWHDSHVAQPIYEKLLTQPPDGFYLVADTAHPHCVNQIQGKIRAPIKTGQRFQGTRDEIENRVVFDRELLSYRQTAKWGMRSLQGSFGRLRIPLEMGHQEEHGDLLEICVRLNNLCAELVGINQIRNVYMPLWRQKEEKERVWGNFETMLFGEQRCSDCVARFHNVAIYDE
jgi:hypothetical protein